MFLSIQSIPGLIFARSDEKAKIRPGFEATRTASLKPMLFLCLATMQYSCWVGVTVGHLAL